MTSITKPMLAVQAEDLTKLRFPILCSRKLDGIRCLIIDGQALSRKFKPIPNHFIRSYLKEKLGGFAESFDGELIVGDTFQSSSSGVMSEAGTPNFIYYVFDMVGANIKQPFSTRFEALTDVVQKLNDPHIQLVEHVYIADYDLLLSYEEEMLAKGYEGVMVRDPKGPYKNGRSTEKEGYLLKIKRFVDTECLVVGFEERLHNANEATIDELGHTKRSSHQENMVPMGTLGSLILKVPEGNEYFEAGLTFGCGTGFDDATRQHIWDNKAKYMGRMAKVKFQNNGIKDVPRFPVFIGWRSEDDL